MKTSVLGLLALSSLAVFSSHANAVLCYSQYTDCLGGTKVAQGSCPDCPRSGTPKPSDGCSYINTPCPEGVSGFKKVTVVCGGCKGA